MRCGHRFDRPKHSISITDWQLRCQALESERDRIRQECYTLRSAIAKIKDAFEILNSTPDGALQARFTFVQTIVDIITDLAETPPIEKDQS
jgi:hypothetical protein